MMALEVRTMKFIIGLLLGFVLIAGVRSAWATPGGVDEQGCHRSKTAGMHCHGERAQSAGSGESVAVRDKRLRRECRGRPDAGACLGYGSPNKIVAH